MISVLRKRRLGVSLTEMMVSVAILSLVMLIVIPAMVYFARVTKGLRNEQRMLQHMNIFLQRMGQEMTAATEVNLVDGSTVQLSGFESEYVEDSSSTTGFTYIRRPLTVELRYEDGDGKPETIKDNRMIIEKTVRNNNGDLYSQERDELLYYLSPIPAPEGSTEDYLPIFTEDTSQARPYVEMQVRMGDRRKPAPSADDALTDAGYQSLHIRYLLMPYNFAST